MADIVSETIPISSIATDIQTRAALNDTVIDEYAEAYEQDADLPPIDVYFDGKVYWLADGFHRLKAIEQLRRDSITANVYEGSKRDAILHAVGANETHGLRRSHADRKAAVVLMLQDDEWRQWSDRDLASRCKVSHMFVNRIRHDLEPQGEQRVTEEKRKYSRKGKVQTMRTGSIAASKRKLSAKPQDVVVEQPVPTGFVTEQESPVTTEVPTGSLAVTALQLDSEEATEPPTVTVLQLDSILPITVSVASKIESDAPSAAAPAEPEPIPETHATAVDHEPVVTPDTVTAGRMTLEPEATTIPEELLQQVTLEVRWEYATRVEQEAFVADHREELQKILEKLGKKLDRQNAVSS